VNVRVVEGYVDPELRGRGVDAQNPTGATRVDERAGMSVVGDAAIGEQELRGDRAP
jgi:hypothetical protein